MAARYWVGGAGNWSSTTKWSTTSGGASGASVPTSVDDAIFDANSGGKFTATVDTAQQVNSLTITPSSGAGLLTISLTAQLTTGALTTSGTAGNNRIFFTSTTYGISINFVVNGAVSISDCDFRGLYVTGTAAPISGTRIGNRGECRGITFSTPKTVYWNLAGAQNWSANGWAATSTGTPSTDYFPLPQDTATFTNAGSVTGNISIDVAALPSVDMSGRTSAMTLALATTTVYGNWTNGSGTTLTNAVTLTLSGGGTQIITSAGKAFTGGITVNTYGGTVQLADALNIGSQTLTVTNGTFNTQGYAVNAGNFIASNANVRAINLGASTVTFSGVSGVLVNIGTTTNLTFNAGTSTINCQVSGTVIVNGALTFYNFISSGTTGVTLTFSNACVFNNLTVTAPASAGITDFVCNANQTINGTLTCAGASAVRRIFLRSDTIGTQRDLTVGTLSANDCDFRDIEILGTASGTAPTRAGDCGGNSGITFPAPKTVYWNLAGVQFWSATGWAASSGGAPAVNNFPLAQDTAVFDNTGAAGTVVFDAAWNIGTFNSTARTSAMTLDVSTAAAVIYGDWGWGTGVTCASNTTTFINFSKNGTQTFTSNGVITAFVIYINHPNAYLQLSGALNCTGDIRLILGTFDAVTYNVTVANGFSNSSTANTLRMGSGTWTITGSGAGWSCIIAPTLFSGTSTIVLSDTSTTARTFAGGGAYYNKLTIGGATGTSTLTITGANTFGELASTKTVAHTITLPSSTTTTIGKWSVTGTVGNAVVVNPGVTVAATLVIAGPATTGIDYLNLSYISVSTTSPGEFYVGANSTNIAGNTGAIIFTATPAPRTLYWVGGTGNWSATTSWSTSSGGASGAAIPTSLDAVVFNSASNATAYTATIDAGVTIARCASFTMAGPASGNVTFAGTVPIAFHGNVSFAATGITRTYTGAMNWAGNSSYTFTTNGVTLASTCNINGIGATWTLGSSITTGSTTTITYGTFNTANYNLTGGSFSSNFTASPVRAINLGSSTITNNITTAVNVSLSAANLTFNAGTSTFLDTTNKGSGGITGAGQTFYNVSFTGSSSTAIAITGANTFNNLSFAGQISGILAVTFNANQTIGGTLTINAGTAAACRVFLASSTLGTARTLVCNAVSATDVDFRDITISGSAAPVTGTRLGDAQGNSGITFPAAKTVYYRQTGSANWGATGAGGSWSATSGGAADLTQFPLAQDTAVFPAATYPASGSTTTISSNYNIGTIDMSARTSNTMTLATGTTTPAIYGNWINGTGTTISGTGTLTFAGRGSQTITSAGKTFTQSFVINTPGGSVTLQDAYNNSAASAPLTLTAGTFDANVYSVTALSFIGTGALTRTAAIGSGTWTLSSPWSCATATNLTVTGTGTISLTGATAKTFAGGGISYSGITLDNGGAGTLSITGNNTFKNITNTYSATGAAAISLGSTTTTLTQFTGTGAAAKLLTLSGTSAASPATLILTSGTVTTPDYLSISNVRAYSLSSTWYAGANSTNLGSLGWIFASAGGVTYNVTITETGTGTDAVSTRVVFNSATAETATGSDTFRAGLLYLSTLSETSTGSDTVFSRTIFRSTLTETGAGSDAISSRAIFKGTLTEAGTGTDAVSSRAVFKSAVAESNTAADTFQTGIFYLSTLSETATATQTNVGYIRFPTSILESASATETVSASAVFRSTTTDTATGTDSVNAPGSTYNPQIAETGTASDLFFASSGVFAFISEAAIGADATLGNVVFVSSTADTATGTDSITALATLKGQIFESAAGADLIFGRLGVVGNISESATGADAISAKHGVSASVLDLATASDAASARASFRATLTETATGTDVVTAPGSTYNPSIIETATGTAVDVGYILFGSTVSEAATGSDAFAAKAAFASTVLNTASVTDSASARAAFGAALTETATILDAASVAPSTFNAPVLELATVTDVLTAPGSIYNPSLAETITISDFIIGGYLWNPIDDSQTPDWGIINDAQTASWAQIDDSQASNWQNVNNTQASGWNEVDDSQDPNWASIKQNP